MILLIPTVLRNPNKIAHEQVMQPADSVRDVLAMGPIPWDRGDGRAPDDVKLDGRPLELPEAEVALLAALFPKLWPVSWPDPDVWPWVIGQPGPRYQHEEGKTPEMKAAIDALRFPWLGR